MNTFFYSCPACGHYMIGTTTGWYCEHCHTTVTAIDNTGDAGPLCRDCAVIAAIDARAATRETRLAEDRAASMREWLDNNTGDDDDG